MVHQPNVPDSNQPRTHVDLVALMRVLRRHWWLLMLLPGLGLAAAMLVNKNSARIYDASVTLRATENSTGGQLSLPSLGGQLGGLAGLSGFGLGGASDQKEKSLAVLRSRSLGLKLIDEGNLLPVIFADKWDEQSRSWQVTGSDIPSRLDGWREFDENIRSIEEERRSGNIYLTIRWTDPEVAASWANQLVELVNRRLQEIAIGNAQRSMVFLEEELQKTNNANIESSLYSLIEQNVATITMANVNKDFAFEIIDSAMAPDAEDYSWPNLLILAAGGIVFGLIIAVLIALFRGQRELFVT